MLYSEHDQRLHTGASYDQYGTELNFLFYKKLGIFFISHEHLHSMNYFNLATKYENSETSFSSSIKGINNIPALLQKYVKSKTNLQNTVLWVFLPLGGEGKIWLQGRKVFVGWNIRNVVCHSCGNVRGQHTVCVLSFSVCLLYFSRFLPNDRRPATEMCEPTEPNR